MRRWRWWFLRRKDAAALLDALRRSNELLMNGNTPYFREEVEHIRAVNWRLLRHYDPAHKTDRTVR